MLPPLAEVDDLETWMQIELSGSSTPRAAAILAAASTLVRRFTGKLWVDENGALVPDPDLLLWDAVQQVVVLVAERVWKNPNGNTQEGTGPFSHTVEAWAALGLALRDEEKEMLGGTAEDGIPGLWSLRVEAPREASGAPRSYPWWDDSELGEGDGS